MKDDKKIYQLLNQTKTSWDDYEPVNVSSSEKRQLLEAVQKNTINSPQPADSSRSTVWHRTPALLTAVLFFSILVGSQTPFGKTVQAAVGGFLENIRYSLSQAFGNENEGKTSTALMINQTGSIGDADVKIEDLLIFGDKLIMNVLIDLPGAREEERFSGFRDFTIVVNGEAVSSPLQVGKIKDFDKEQNIYSMINTVYLSQEVTRSEEITIDIHVRDIYKFNYEHSEILEPYKGEADFSLHTSADEYTRFTKEYDIHHSVHTDRYDYTIEKIYLHPIISFINITTENLGEEYQLIEVKGTDEKGRQVVFEPDGYQEDTKFWRGSYIFSEEASELSLEQLSEAESLELQFYSAGHPEGTSAIYVPYGEPFVVKLKK